jgi:hypothetical protein
MSHANAPAVLRLAADLLGSYESELAHFHAEHTQARTMLDAAGIAADTVPAAVAMLIKERAEWRARMPAGPDVGTQVMADIAYACAARRKFWPEACDDRNTRREWADRVKALLASANDPLALDGEYRDALLRAVATLVAALEADARCEGKPPAPDVAPGGAEWRGRELFVGGRYEGLTGFVGNGEWMVAFGNRQIDGLPNEATARAVLLALAGKECGRVVFGLRETATVLDLRKLRASPMEWVYDDLLNGDPSEPTTWTTGPEAVRAWVAEWQSVLTISVSE